jgi:Tail specific protease N-terminal domain
MKFFFERIRVMSRRIVGWTFLVVSLCVFDDRLGFITSRASAEELQPTTNDRLITKGVVEIIQEKHILRLDLGPELAGQALDDYLRALDPQKLYFLQADVAGFQSLFKQETGRDISREQAAEYAERLIRLVAFAKGIDISPVP